MPKRQQTIEAFPYGTINTIEKFALPNVPKAAAYDNLNWVSIGNKVELRRGYATLGNSTAGTGKITGIHVGYKADGTAVGFRAQGQKLLYYDTDTETWTEIVDASSNANLLGADADGEDVAFANYSTPAGNQVWASSPNSGLFKIMTANPGIAKDNYLNTKNFRGRIRITQNRMVLFFRDVTSTIDKIRKDISSVYLSYVDAQSWTTVSSEVLDTGDGATKAFSGTLAAVTGRRTCFAISVTDSTETFTDDGNGVLTGDAGGTGTINYSTGAISVTFNANVNNLQDITVDYQWEDSTDNGIADFTYASPRTVGQGDFLLQNLGGQIQNVLVLDQIHYCFHEDASWQVTITQDDTNLTNLPYREQVGISNWRAADEAEEGIYYIDNINEKDPQFRLLSYATGGSSQIVPRSISKQIKYNKERVGIDLTDYRFNNAAVKVWGDYVLFACRHKDDTNNNRLFIYDRVKNTIDLSDYWVTCMEEYNGTLIAGDSVSNNVYTLFSGFDDDGALIENNYDLGFYNNDFNGMKKCKKFIVKGEIGVDQDLEIYANIDNGGYTLIDTIDGSGDYVDIGQKINVGAVTVGSNEIGGGSGGVDAYHYEAEIDVGLDKYEYISIRFKAIGIGYVSVQEFRYFDIRRRSPDRIPKKYRL